MAPEPTAAEALYGLAASCGVGIGEACDRAGIARSTPPRWKNGTRPRPQQLGRLRHAILAIARERDQVPESSAASEVSPEPEPLSEEAAVLRKVASESSQDHAKIMSCLNKLVAKVDRIERVLAQLGTLSLVLDVILA